MKVSRTTSNALACIACIMAEPSSTRAAVVSGQVGAALSSVTTFNLTSQGTLDWAYWNSTATSSASGTAANSKSGSTLIGDMFVVGTGASLRGSTSTTKPLAKFSFTDGTSPISGTTSSPVTGLFSTQLDTNGAGVGFTVTLPTVQTYTVYVWAGVFSLSSTHFTASLTGATNYTSNALVYAGASGGSAKDTYLVSLTVTPDNPGDMLSVVFTSNQITTAQSAHTLIAGVAVSPAAAIPEPASAGLLAGLAGLAAVLTRRRRRRS